MAINSQGPLLMQRKFEKERQKEESGWGRVIVTDKKDWSNDQKFVVVVYTDVVVSMEIVHWFSKDVIGVVFEGFYSMNLS